MSTVVVVGAGIAGLAAARILSEHHDVTLLEADERPGGKLASGEFRSRPLDLGADAFITRNRAARELVEDLGLGDELLAPATSRAAIAARDRLRPFPAGLVLGVPTRLVPLWRSGIVRRREVLRAGLDLLDRRRVLDPDHGDATVAEVFGPRLGGAVVDTLIDPLLGGINASDCEVLSLAACAPQLFAQLTGARSVLRALRANAPPPGGAAGEPLFLGLASGMGTFASALSADCVRRGVELRLNSRVEVLGRNRSGWVLESAAGERRADAVVIAAPAFAAAEILAASEPALAEECAAIPYAGVATVTLAFRVEDVGGAGSSAFDGSGVLVPRRSGHLVTAATFTSTKWPRSANPGEIVVRASVGRHRDERADALDDAVLAARVRAELEELVGLSAEPLETLVVRWPRAFPQYVRGHLERVARIEAGAASIGGLALCGAAYHGIGIPACIDSGARAARSLTAVD